jgi:hypothetical protein
VNLSHNRHMLAVSLNLSVLQQLLWQERLGATRYLHSKTTRPYIFADSIVLVSLATTSEAILSDISSRSRQWPALIKVNRYGYV